MDTKTLKNKNLVGQVLPKQFTNVKVWAFKSWSWSKADAKIKNLRIGQPPYDSTHDFKTL